MLSIEPFTDKNEDSNSHLFFIIGTSSGYVHYSSLPMDFFFGTGFDAKQKFPFLNNAIRFDPDPDQKKDLEKKWQSCLELPEKQSGNFSFITATKDNQPVIYHFDALNAQSFLNFNEPVILFSVKKSVVEQTTSFDEKNRDNYRKDYAEFIDIAAHDLDAPLRKISLLIERLAQKTQLQQPNDLQGHFDRIQTSLSEMRSLIDNLSAWAAVRPDNSSQPACNLNEIVEQSLEQLRVKHPAITINAEWKDLPTVNGNKREYEQLFHRIFENAVRYRKNEENVNLKITNRTLSLAEVASYKIHPAIKYTSIAVTDDGIGFAPEYASKIFRPFSRLHGKSEYPGTGMGLAICKKIVENYGGVIYAESEENKGATFTLILPQSF